MINVSVTKVTSNDRLSSHVHKLPEAECGLHKTVKTQEVSFQEIRTSTANLMRQCRIGITLISHAYVLYSHNFLSYALTSAISSYL